MRLHVHGQEHDAPGRVRVRGPLSQQEISRLLSVSRQSVEITLRRAQRKLATRFPELLRCFQDQSRVNR